VIESVDFWTDGPQLSSCDNTVVDGSTKYALSGILLLPEGAEAGFVVLLFVNGFDFLCW
jgi:hypothetical protein